MASVMVEKVVRSAVANATEQDVAPKRNALFVSAAPEEGRVRVAWTAPDRCPGRDALVASAARKLVTLNLEPQSGETEGFSPETHLEVLSAHAPELKLDVVLADEGTVSDVAGLRAAVASLGGELVLADVAADDGTPRHDSVKLANAYASFMREA